MTAIDRARLVVTEDTGSLRRSPLLLTAAVLALVVGFGALAEAPSAPGTPGIRR